MKRVAVVDGSGKLRKSTDGKGTDGNGKGTFDDGKGTDGNGKGTDVTGADGKGTGGKDTDGKGDSSDGKGADGNGKGTVHKGTFDDGKGQDDKGNGTGNDKDKDMDDNDKEWTIRATTWTTGQPNNVVFYSGHTVYPKGTNAICAQHLHMQKIGTLEIPIEETWEQKYHTWEILGPTNIRRPAPWHPWWHPDRNVRSEALDVAFKAAGEHMKANNLNDWTKQTANAAFHAAWDYKMGYQCGYDSEFNIDTHCIDNP